MDSATYIDECYCGMVENSQVPNMLTCETCKKHFHTGCLVSGKPSPLEGDIFYSFKCTNCGDGGQEEFERMKLQWLQVVMLTLYNLQLSGAGKFGYFRWKEHICAFIDKYWSLLFASHRKKTSLWYGTVAGTLSSGCPLYFLSGAQDLGEPGWWRLTEMRPPLLKPDPGPRGGRKKVELIPASTSPKMKLEALRSRRGKTSIEAAIELKAKRSTLLEAKDIRKAKTKKQVKTDQAEYSVSTPSSSTFLSTVLTPVQVSPLLESKETKKPKETRKNRSQQVKNDQLQCSVPTTYPSTGAVTVVFTPTTQASPATSSSNTVLQLPSVESFQLFQPAGMSTTEEPQECESSAASASLHSSFSSAKPDVDEDTCSQFSHSSSTRDIWLTEKDLKPCATIPQLLMKEDDDDESESDFEIDPGTISPPGASLHSVLRDSPTVEEILSTMDENSGISEEISQNPLRQKRPSNADEKTGELSEADSAGESEAGSDEEESDSSEMSELPEKKKRRAGKAEKVTEEKPPPPKCNPMSLYDEKQLLKKLNFAAEKHKLDPEINRLRRKLIIRQLKRERGLPLFDLDMEMMQIARQDWGSTHDPEQLHCLNPYSLPVSRFTGGEVRILDRFQMGFKSVRTRSQQHPSFLNRLVGTEDDQLQSICSPYSTRVLKPFIRRDYESRPSKMRLLEDIKAHHNRNDPNWKPQPPPPIDYCYVRPQHIPSVNALCRAFFWPGIDLSECLQYPDFSCVVLFRKIVIGFAFMVPDVKYNEAYISFIFTHPEWRRAGIARFMLYHLIQTCMGKDVTLHVSATNTAMLLYQKFGFKPEEFILDFYDKYYPMDSGECKHAFFLRLRR